MMRRTLDRAGRQRAALVLAAWCVLAPWPASARASALGLASLPQADGGAVTIYYPARGSEVQRQQGPFTLSVAADGTPVAGNGRLIVISHGSGGSPWVHYDLARVLVARGFTVALPQHRGDNYRDPSAPGPASWRLRPAEVSAAIDLVAHSRFGNAVDTSAVGVFGGSAGGHTALELAGGRWSEARFRDHCQQHAQDDFAACVGLSMRLRGNVTDHAKLWAVKRVIGWKFSDPEARQQRDPRIRAALAMVPFAADFDPASLARPAIALGLVVARQDTHLAPGFHVERVLAACLPRCEVVMDLARAGHGAMLSPLPPLEAGSIAARLLADPAGFRRARELGELHARVAAFFERRLPAAARNQTVTVDTP